MLRLIEVAFFETPGIVFIHVEKYLTSRDFENNAILKINTLVPPFIGKTDKFLALFIS